MKREVVTCNDHCLKIEFAPPK